MESALSWSRDGRRWGNERFRIVGKSLVWGSASLPLAGGSLVGKRTLHKPFGFYVRGRSLVLLSAETEDLQRKWLVELVRAISRPVDDVEIVMSVPSIGVRDGVPRKEVDRIGRTIIICGFEDPEDALQFLEVKPLQFKPVLRTQRGHHWIGIEYASDEDALDAINTAKFELYKGRHLAYLIPRTTLDRLDAPVEEALVEDPDTVDFYVGLANGLILRQRGRRDADMTSLFGMGHGKYSPKFSKMDVSSNEFVFSFISFGWLRDDLSAFQVSTHDLREGTSRKNNVRAQLNEVGKADIDAILSTTSDREYIREKMESILLTSRYGRAKIQEICPDARVIVGISDILYPYDQFPLQVGILTTYVIPDNLEEPQFMEIFPHFQARKAPSHSGT